MIFSSICLASAQISHLTALRANKENQVEENTGNPEKGKKTLG